jgi:hypothetical protein
LPTIALPSLSRAVQRALYGAGIRGAAVALLTAGVAGPAAANPKSQTEEFPAAFELSSLLPVNGGDGTNGFVLNGIDLDDRSGTSVSGAGDVNDDGIDDLIIGAPGAAPGVNNTGASYVVFGGAGVSAGGSVDLSSLDGTDGFVLIGVDGGDSLGISVSAAGDVNADGSDDLIVGATRAGSNGGGASYVVFGGAEVGADGSVDLSSLDGTNGFVLPAIGSADYSGFSVSGAGDVNGDGIDDVLIGAFLRDANQIHHSGESYLVFGEPGVGAGGSVDLSSLDGTNGFVLRGLGNGDYTGFSVSGAGDVNGDGTDDLIIGAHHADGDSLQSGKTYVVFGGAGVGSDGRMRLNTLDGTNGFVLLGTENFDRSGISVSAAGDMNGDGIDDLIIGAYHATPDDQLYAGKSYVVFGGPEAGGDGNVRLSSLDGTNGLVLNGIVFDDHSGISVSAAGDVNADGSDDVIVGAAEADPIGVSNAGESYVVFGSAGVGAGGSVELYFLDGTNGFVLNGIDVGDFSGHSVSGAGDLNDDGIDDMVIGAFNADPDGDEEAGETYVVFGRAPTDTDADGVSDDADNCVLQANTDQRDTDEDRFGNVCDADLDNNCTINFVDLALLKSVFFGTDPNADFDGNGVVNFQDLGTMRSSFFQPPGPSGLATCD